MYSHHSHYDYCKRACAQIPPWDFSVESLALVDRDSSAAAIAASGLIELDGCVLCRG